ncbi:MAG TPA: hypothetical protein VJ783_12470 [Pirellulales bacterium]|nr:hypothetical protein [Pirellulales bacterium]
MDYLCVPLQVRGAMHATAQPIVFGVPLPKGPCRHVKRAVLADDDGSEVACQTTVLARWSDGSAKWVLVDALLPDRRGAALSELQIEPGERCDTVGPSVSGEWRIETGAASYRIDRRRASLFDWVDSAGLSLATLKPRLVDQRGRTCDFRIEQAEIVADGEVRTSLLLHGAVERYRRLKFRAQLCFFHGTGLTRVRFTLHNSQRARHRGGLWDLGDPNSFLFREFSLGVQFIADKNGCTRWTPESGEAANETTKFIEIYQGSSGGKNWQSRNHVNREGGIPCELQGYRVVTASGETRGLRASPVVAIANSELAVGASVPEFWQQFPKAIAADGRRLTIGLFPSQWGDLHELQGGEQKTHETWLHFGTLGTDPLAALAWVAQPVRIAPAPEWTAASKALLWFAPAAESDERLRTFLGELIDPEQGLLARREVIDEYGWRNFGDTYADHENAYYNGPKPVVSHYNNQYDVVYGALLQWLSTGDPAWADLFCPLARHVVDIDIYHTSEDRAAYNGGLFWHTDHYREALTASHRCFSRGNQPVGSRYGGGPSNEHNYTTGLLHYYFLTGCLEARRAVTELADWVIASDEGCNNLLGLIDPGPTGRATATTEPGYHGPGRGAGNSINALLDAWLLSGKREYLEVAESLIRRAIHPQDDIESLGLLDTERRWSYTVFLAVLSKYLELKAEAGEIDGMYGFAERALVHYGQWMMQHERPYFDRPEQLEFPTETWAAHDLRKANVLRLAAAHAEGGLRAAMLDRGAQISERAWSDLLRFASCGCCRAAAIILTEGLRERSLCSALAPKPKCTVAFDFPFAKSFVPQQKRVRRQLCTFRGWVAAAKRLANPLVWTHVRLSR